MTAAQTVLDRFIRLVEEEGKGVHGTHVLVGSDAAEHRWHPDVREDIHSVSKGVSVLAAGMAADEGIVSLDVPVATYLPDFARGEGVDDVTLRHLLTMTSGIDLPWSPTMLTDWPDLAREFLSRPSRGRVFHYSNASTYTAMRALGAVVGDVRDWLVPRLFDPLGIHDPQWERCPLGWIAAGGGLALRTEELARIGRLIRDRGVWEGQRLIDPEWIDAMHAGWVVAGENPGYDRYALAGWAGPGDTWRLHGAYGQFLLFDEERDAVFTITSHEESNEYRIAELADEALAA